MKADQGLLGSTFWRGEFFENKPCNSICMVRPSFHFPLINKGELSLTHYLYHTQDSRTHGIQYKAAQKLLKSILTSKTYVNSQMFCHRSQYMNSNLLLCDWFKTFTTIISDLTNQNLEAFWSVEWCKKRKWHNINIQHWPITKRKNFALGKVMVFSFFAENIVAWPIIILFTISWGEGRTTLLLQPFPTF